MNDDDLRKCFAMFVVTGKIMSGKSWTAEQVWEIADALVDAQNPQPEIGLPAIKRRKAK
jgi:isopropylmalate/homocitrate/citramalate synthase